MTVVLRTFGGLALLGDGLPPSCSQRRRLALLAILARGRELRVTRDRVHLLLWSERPTSSARHALDQLLYATRRDLGRSVITTVDGQLRLEPDVVAADCVAFERSLAEGRFEQAVELHAGPFLDGFHLDDAPEFERWVDAQRAALAAQWVAALERLATASRERGDHVAAAAWWRRRAAAEPLDARVARQLMQALVDAGDRPAALRHAHAHARLVQEELGVAPDASLLAFAHEVATALAPSAPTVPGRSSLADHGPTAPTAGDPHSPTAIGAPVAESGVRPRPPRFGRAERVAAAAAVLGVLAVGIVAIREDAAGSPRRHAPTGPDSLAVRIYEHGRIAWNYRTRAGLDSAVVLFRRAIERDPMYAEAYAGLADAYVLLGYHGFLAGDASFPKGKAAAQRALELRPELGPAYAALGMALQWERRWADAERAFRQGIAYAPEYATGHQWYALLLTVLARPDEAVVHGRRAAELDPLSVQIHNTYGVMLLNAGELDSALHVYERIVRSEPDSAWVRQNPWVLDNFGKVAGASGRYEEAARLFEQAAAVVPGHPRPVYHLAHIQLAAGDTQAARRTFARADTAHAYYPLYRALQHAQLGEIDEAFGWLDRVSEWGLPALNALVHDPALALLRSDARYAALKRRLMLPAS